jgi:DNA-binding CsgD family transcriptional regulator
VRGWWSRCVAVDGNHPAPELNLEWRLTRRDREVLTRVIAGDRNVDIARRLRISVATVEYHETHMLAKLSARSRAEAVAIALGRREAMSWPRPA